MNVQNHNQLNCAKVKTPLAFFAYNRPEHAQRALQALHQCRRAAECDFYFFSDGPRSEDVWQKVNATRAVLAEWALKMNAVVVERSQNLGLAKSIATGVSELTSRYGRVIVVEDDLVVAPDFLHYMIEALDHYEVEDRVMQVGAFTISPPESVMADAFLLPVTTTWGWATWQRAWRHFSWLPKELDVAKHDKEWLALFNLNKTCAFLAMLEDRLAGRNDSWGILWWYAVSRHRGLVVYPKRSLVWNGGFDGSGVHCGKEDFLGQNPPLGHLNMKLPESLVFPSDTQFEPEHLSQLEDFFRSRSDANQLSDKRRGMECKLKVLALKLKEGFCNAIH
jgi:hypothetical protein